MTVECARCDRRYSAARPDENLRWRRRPDAEFFEIVEEQLVDGFVGHYLEPVCRGCWEEHSSALSIEGGMAEWIVQEVMRS